MLYPSPTQRLGMEATATAAAQEHDKGSGASRTLWGDAWRRLRQNKLAIIAAIVPFRIVGKLDFAHVQGIVLVPEIGCSKALRQKALPLKLLKCHVGAGSLACIGQKFRLVQAGIVLESLGDQTQMICCRCLFHPDCPALNDPHKKGQHETCDKDGAKDFHQGKARLACSCPCSGHCPP